MQCNKCNGGIVGGKCCECGAPSPNRKGVAVEAPMSEDKSPENIDSQWKRIAIERGEEVEKMGAIISDLNDALLERKERIEELEGALREIRRDYTCSATIDEIARKALE